MVFFGVKARLDVIQLHEDVLAILYSAATILENLN
jgi:hypothetical protein